MADPTLTKEEAYLAMYAFLENYYDLSKSDEVGGLLGSMSLLQDGNPADIALQEDWDHAVEKALAGNVDAQLRLGR